MQIELKSNRHFIYKVFIPILFSISIVLIGMTFVLIDDYGTGLDFKNDIILIILCVIWDVSALFVILFAKFYKGKSYKFTENEIIVYKRDKQIDVIQIENIKYIHYYKFKFRYIITIFAGALNEGSCWKMHVWLNNGLKKEIGFFSVKDITMLQEKLYKDLIKIMT